MKLTASQRDYLRGLRDDPNRYAKRGITNATMTSLEKRGLAKIEVLNNPSGWKDFLWRITDAGRSALSPKRVDTEHEKAEQE